uniref:Ig-like domain-containing protein n=1 Tax=Anabas testudineus TaxID=64144 RepID=A0A7N6FFN7_ANATE
MLVWLFSYLLNREAQKDNVLQPEGDETQTEGDTVTLDCLYNSSSTNDYLFWYKQDGNNRPRFILSLFKIGQGKTEDEFKERFSSRLNSTFRSVPLKIQKLHVSDSAVYYCSKNLYVELGNRIISITELEKGTEKFCSIKCSNEHSSLHHIRRQEVFYLATCSTSDLYCLAAVQPQFSQGDQ